MKEELELFGVHFFCWAVDQLFTVCVADDQELHAFHFHFFM
jgi:hypothetical protein